MNTLIKLSFLLILITTRCKDTTLEKNNNSKKKEISESSDNFNAKSEKLRIETLINNEKIDYYHYLKSAGETRLVEYAGDESIFDQLGIEREYIVYYKKSRIVAVKEIEYWGEEGYSSIIYYYKDNGKLFCYDYFSISVSEGNVEQKATIFMDENINITNETYQRKTHAGVTNNKMDFEENPMFYKTVDEIMSAFALEDCKSKIYNSNSSNSNSTIVSQTNNEGLMLLRDIQLALLDSSLKKSKILLGEPDVREVGFGHISKGFVVFYNKVSNPNGTPKHLVLFLRMQGNQWGNNAEIEEIYAVDDNQKACFGIHCIKIKNQTIYTNELGLIYDKGYKSMN
jgi:hypothetical protein